MVLSPLCFLPSGEATGFLPQPPPLGPRPGGGLSSDRPRLTITGTSSAAAADWIESQRPQVLDIPITVALRSLKTETGEEMRIRFLFVLSSILFLIAAGASAGPKEDVAAATMKWGETLGQDDPDKAVALYAPDAVFWGTLSPTVRTDRAALRDYFVTAFKVLPNLHVAFGEQFIRVYGTTAVNTGYYTFSYVKDGESKTLPARYSFTFVKDGEKWMIVDHHSSAMPPPPR